MFDFSFLQLNQIPTDAGVYQMLGKNGRILYIGKAKNLRYRVRSYFQKSAVLPLKTQLLVAQVVRIQTIATRSEYDALVLEQQLVRTHQPRFNVLLKDDKSYPFIQITQHEPFPRIRVTRERRNDGHLYFGPFASIGSTTYLVRLIHDLFPIRDCKQDIDLENRQPKCLKLDLGKCVGPCIYKDVKPAYDRMVTELKLLLSGRHTELVRNLEKTMAEYARSHAFEKAAKVRDQIQRLTRFRQRQLVNLPGMPDLHVWATASDERNHYVLVQQYVEGKLLYQQGYFVAREAFPVIWDFFVETYVGFYNAEVSKPDAILCEQLGYDVLNQIEGHPKSWGDLLIVPKIGEKAQVLQMAQKNARLALIRVNQQAEVHIPKPHINLAAIQSALGLSRLPRRVIGFDISHLGGQGIVASAVYFLDGKPFRGLYRIFHIRTVVGQSDDVRSIREVVLRRMRHVIDDGESMPDLLLIDGGPIQRDFAMDALRELALDGKLDTIGLAKKEEILWTTRGPVALKHHDPGLQFFQRIRDEAHRFANRHQQKRRFHSLSSVLSELKGMGPKRVQKLYHTYHSVAQMRQVAPAEMAKAIGIPLRLAEEVIVRLTDSLSS